MSQLLVKSIWRVAALATSMFFSSTSAQETPLGDAAKMRQDSRYEHIQIIEGQVTSDSACQLLPSAGDVAERLRTYFEARTSDNLAKKVTIRGPGEGLDFPALKVSMNIHVVLTQPSEIRTDVLVWSTPTAEYPQKLPRPFRWSIVEACDQALQERFWDIVDDHAVSTFHSVRKNYTP